MKGGIVLMSAQKIPIHYAKSSVRLQRSELEWMKLGIIFKFCLEKQYFCVHD